MVDLNDRDATHAAIRDWAGFQTRPKACCHCGSTKSVRPFDGPTAVVDGRPIITTWQCLAARPCKARQNRLSPDQKRIGKFFAFGLIDTLEEEPALAQIAEVEARWAELHPQS